MRAGIILKDSESVNEFIKGAQTNLMLSTHSTLDECKTCEVIVDLEYEYSGKNTDIERFAANNPECLIIINAVCTTLEELPQNIVRINGWKTFLSRPVVEASCRSNESRNKADNFFALTGRKTEWVPDIPGFLSARVIAMIINEAYFTLQDKISSREEIDIAMKLGTNYPYGPFEWSKLIGLKNIFRLLQLLENTNQRYAPAELLISEANS